MGSLNNVDLDKISKTVSAGKADKSTLLKPVKLQGQWMLNGESSFQFKTELAFEKGTQVLEIDSPSFLGGNGNRLGPMAYCIAGITSCFIGTFASIAASQGVVLTKLGVSTQCNANFAKTLDVADEPIVDKIEFKIDAKSNNASKEQLDLILKMALDRCPAMYSMSHVIPVHASITE
jgi:uncharacterized OsmC-like protein